MASDTLSYHDCERFYLLRDTLATFTHIELGLEGDFLYDASLHDATDLDSFLASVEADDDAPLFNEQAVATALDEALGNPEVNDRYIAANVASLDKADLAIVESWKAALTEHFVVFKHVGKLMLLSDNRIYHVTGLLEPLENVLDRLPSHARCSAAAASSSYPRIVQTTLLPFGDKIVYSGFAYTMPLQIGSGMQSMLADEISRALRTGEHVTSGERLVDLAPVIAEERVSREAQLMMDDLELDMKAEQQLPGHHEGVLVGMTEEERDEAVRGHFRESSPTGSAFDPKEHLRKDCTEGPERSDLASLISLQNKAMLQRQALLLGLPHGESIRKDRLVETIVAEVQVNPSLFSIALSGLFPTDFANYRTLYEQAGVMRIAVDDVKSLKGLPPVFEYMCYLFEEDGQFAFIIPDETFKGLALVDWEECEAYVNDTQQAIDIADAITCLRGIVTFEEAFIEFKRCYPEAFDQHAFEAAVGSAIEDGYLACDLIDDGSCEYLVHFELGYVFKSENGYGKEYLPPEIVLHGDPGTLKSILQHHEGKVGRTLDEDMRTSGDVYYWRERRPAVRALRNYLDAHVPDDADDYFFAEKVIEDLIDYMQAGFVSANSVRDYLSILEDNGFVPDEAHLRKVLDLLMNMSNAMPTWVNNGWAPAELHEAFTGKKTFYNEDGSVMKVGRNDPCPCGSGKKYKKCCGR